LGTPSYVKFMLQIIVLLNVSEVLSIKH